MRSARLIQDPRRDAAAIVGLAGLLAFIAVPVVVGRACDLASSVALPLIGIAPTVLAAAIVIRSSRAGAVAAAIALFIVLFALEAVLGFLIGLDHCGLELGLHR